ncbi:HAMP domain-containing protein [Pseudomonas mediterranea]|uniref:histidine kinase n=2 Tax=Pseudomonas mediterranea TaxID=183795 RepID=A0AAX2DA45_9PSED|nr:ATP-binding protein [Pseudomonas mediterranea]KGU85457.1 histidine kinase [Pseudomonas mediterranea CFBP 5447]MBL0844923.1 HAMP domain-containing protein [Pseudomonas mediterranea]MDU9027124.1 ATP-binding protein [Pseudomonas mediterranea]QHA84053.1 HAMP domain-containing protein [Pseudomonas mediterranea]CAH0244298.1 Sensor protein RstB [Pseudomonas mediterranea]
MNSIFLRIYGGMCAALVLVAVLGVLALHLLNQTRSEQYRERLAHGTFSLMAENLRPMNDTERHRALLLWERLLGIPLGLQTFAQTDLDLGQRTRVLRGQALVEQTGPHAAKVYRLVSDGEQLMLVGEVQQISEQLARATIYLLADELVRYPVGEQPRRLAQIMEEKGFGFDLRLMTAEQADMDEDQRRRVSEGDTVMALGKGGDSIRVFAGMVGTPWVLEIGPLYQMNPYPPEWLVLIAALGLSLIGLIVYLLVRQLERRLSGLEAAATQIAQGSLETRVPARGADSVGRLAAAFNGMAEHLQQLLAIQRELVRAVSHELRTPVARLRFGLEMLGSAATPQAREKYLAGMDHDIEDLDRLVDEMLTYARLEQGSPALNFQRVDLDALVNQVIDELGPLRVGVTVERGLCLSAADCDGAWVEAEPRFLHRALQNLVSNAMRHARSRVTLSYQVGQLRCRVDVEDDGPGVPEAAWERVFKPFLRLDDSRARASGGHGLGLSIVRRIIYWHGGRALIAKSKSLGGACFSLSWPRHQDRG